MPSDRVVISSIDDNYVWPFLVSFFSMSKNATDSFRIVLGYDPNLLSPQSRDLILDIAKILCVELQFLSLDLRSLNTNNMRHVTISTYSRLLMFDVCEDSVLWLDADVLCLSHWDSIFCETLEMSPNQIALAVKDPISENVTSLPLSSNLALLECGASYFNSGVLYVDTNKWRDATGPLLWRSHYANYLALGFEFEDQCILNYSLAGRCKLMPRSFNHIVAKDAPFDSTIKLIHFAGALKPWHLKGHLRLTSPGKPMRHFYKIYRDYEALFLKHILESSANLWDELNLLRQNSTQGNTLYHLIFRRLIPIK